MRKFKILQILLLVCFFNVSAQDDTREKSMEIYGAIMLDMGHDYGKMQSDWYDVMRPTKILDGNGNEYEPQGNFFMGVRQTRFGIKNYFDTGVGTLKTHFEFEMFGTGVDAGQTTFRLRHAYAEMGKFGVGQYWSPFMDVDVFPNSIEYWGPCGMVFFRNVQIRYMPIKEDNTFLTIALERPGASADQGQYGNGFVYPIENGIDPLSNVNFRFPLPDLSAEYRHGGDWGYVELAGILRSIHWEDNNNDSYDLSGRTLGWGLNLSSNLKFGKKVVFRGSVTTGEGIQNYMNDSDVDVGIRRRYNNATKPIEGTAIPIFAMSAFFDINWNSKFSSSVGYSRQDNNTTEAQLATAYQSGQYALANLLYYPAKNCMMGVEVQAGSRQNNDFGGDPFFNLAAQKGNRGSDVKLQFSFKYNFNETFYKKS